MTTSLQIRRAVMLVVSAPSGAGKTTLCDRLVADFPALHYSVSCTTRAPREGESHGRSYYFLSPDDFEARVARGEFIEHATVHGNRYGTLRSEVERFLRGGQDVLLDIDVQGADSIRRHIAAAPADDPLRRAYTDVFVAPPSVGELRRRLVSRGKDSAEVIDRRVRQAAAEMERCGDYRYLVVNDDLEEAYAVLKAILVAEHARTGSTPCA